MCMKSVYSVISIYEQAQIRKCIDIRRRQQPSTQSHMSVYSFSVLVKVSACIVIIATD